MIRRTRKHTGGFTLMELLVEVGDQVDVLGTVDEFFGFTELTDNPVVTVDSSANPLPPAVMLNDTVPSPDPVAPSCAIEFECYEGMLVQVVKGTVAASNQEFGSDPFAEVHVIAGAERAFREPGIEFPGLPGLPLWDGNPEVFELDPDKLGLPNQVIPAGSRFTATGVIGFEFGGYELWPSTLTVEQAVIPAPVRDRERAELTIGSLNMFRLFDDIDDPEDNTTGRTRDDAVVSTAEYDRRRAKLAAYVLDVLNAPDVLAVQEVEKLEVLAGGYGIGRGIHLGDTVLGTKGRVAFEAPAAVTLITAHRELEKLVLSAQQMRVFSTQSDAPPCHECGAIMVRNAACYVCINCGATSGCS